jgi:anti-anti-sigma regulatory factor
MTVDILSGLDDVSPTDRRQPLTDDIDSRLAPTQVQETFEKVVMIFGGEYDLACKEHLRADLEPLTGVQDVVLDFTDVTYIDSTIIVELMRMHQQRVSKSYKRETIVVQNQNIKKLFTLLSLQDAFYFVPDLDHVVQRNQEPVGLRYASCGGHRSGGGHVPDRAGRQRIESV